MLHLVRRLSVSVVARAFVIALLASGGCVSQACPDGQKLADGKCERKGDTHDGGAPDADTEKQDSGGEEASRADMHRDAEVDAGEPEAVADAGESCGAMVSVMCWKDADEDGFAAAASESMHMCGDCPAGWTSIEPVNDEVDCRESDADTHPIRCWRDKDEDGYAADGAEMTRPCAEKCARGTTSAEPAGDAVDCDDKSEDIHPNALEACNGEDDDCDRGTDEDADKTCDLANASGVCVHAACAIDECKKGFDDCDHDSANGCEQSLNAEDNCGGCGIECSVLGTCKADQKVGQCECKPPSFGDGSECRGPGPLSAGYTWTCAIDDDKKLDCWGHAAGLLTEPGISSSYQQIATGVSQLQVGCGIKFNDAIECWAGVAISGPKAAGTTSKFIQVVVGEEFICGLTKEMKAECWKAAEAGGYGNPGTVDETLAPDDTFTQLAAGAFHVCGLHEDGTAKCWGLGSPSDSTNCASSFHCGQASPPSDEFVQLAAGWAHTCGIKKDGKVKCWGLGAAATPMQTTNVGQATPPSDVKMVWISAGRLHTCGIRADDGTAICWGAGGGEHTTGDFDHGQSTPPTDEFLVLTAGWSHTCGLTTHESVVCWGNNSDGQAPALTSGPFPLVPVAN